MFYSHTFLARKGPLGTVWCAAHLQHKLRKSHYIKTNVSTTVEKIMNPEVPIALRMSGHLLLGVVRIYSKQVDYFFEDCNEIRITINRVFTTISVNLPSDATQAPFHSVTLPEKFNLDNVELDDYGLDWREDSHLKSHDEIMLTEQIPTGTDPYIVISFDEHDLRTSSSMEETSGSGPTPMEEDDVPRGEFDASAAGFGAPSRSNKLGAFGSRTPQDIPSFPRVEFDASAAGFETPSRNNNLGAFGSRTPQDIRSIEIMRDAQYGFDFNNSPILPDRALPDKFLEDQIIRDNKEMQTPVREEVVLPDARFSSSHNHGEQHSPVHLDSQIPFAHHSPELELQLTPEMEIQPTPPLAKEKVRRKRKQPYDTTTVLSNEHVKNALEDTSDILRERRNCPLTSLSIWKRNNRRRLRKEGLFVEPYVTGSSAELQGIYSEDCAKNHLVSIQETSQETNVEKPSSSRHDNDIEIEVLRNNDRASPEICMPSFSTPVPSPSGRSHFTPEKSNADLLSEHLEMTDRTLPTSDVGASGNLDSGMRTPDAFCDSDMRFDNTVLSDIPELVPSSGDLGFLEQDDDSPAGSQGTPQVGVFPGNQSTPELSALSSRTRAVAQYLKKQSATPISSSLEESSENLTLKKILNDKPRKICARMFYETLVLKNCGLVDVHQEKSYDDIVLKVTPKLSKEQFSV
ncbi:sister chromatid cohesion 1 protein 3-like [Salvia splendens]|uniref:sister chromatid cohesion 1 protein 3-like n=1 Tax=Salvia splendens TaxID=180675 RepID=UPI001C27AAB4|nr:sister chromatid cohesion 1 protein 3-like [Salvia splendens]